MISSPDYQSGLQTSGPTPGNDLNLVRIAVESLEQLSMQATGLSLGLQGPYGSRLPIALHPPPELASSFLQQLLIPQLQYNGLQRLL